MVHNWIHYKKTQWLFFKFEFSFYHHAKISLQVGPPNLNLANYAHVQIQYLLLNSHLQNLSSSIHRHDVVWVAKVLYDGGEVDYVWRPCVELYPL